MVTGSILARRLPGSVRWGMACLASFLLLGVSAPGRGEHTSGAEAVMPGAAGSVGTSAGETPRRAMEDYLHAARDGDYARAARTLDLRSLPPAQREQGPTLARELKVVLDRTLWVDLDALSDEPDGDPGDGSATRDVVGSIQTSRGPTAVLLQRVALEDGTHAWRVAAPTVAQIPALYAEFGEGWVAELLPTPLVEIRVLEVRLWQWIGLLILLVLATAVSWVLATGVVGTVRSLLRRARTGFDDALLALAVGPLRLTLAVSVFSTGTYALGLALPVHRFFVALEKALTIVAVTWLLLRLADVLCRALERHLVAQGKATAMSMVPLGRRTVKVFLGGLAAIATLQNLGFNVTGILAGLGVGGLAIALAAQKTVENLFGGVTLIADQPVRVGDFCRFGDRVGTVEDIGLRSTRVRTLERTVVTIPNAQFSATELENFAWRDRIWLKTTIGLRYETTPDQLRHVLVELKKLLLAHPMVHPEPARVRFVGFGAYSLDLEIFAYVVTTDINEFIAVREDIFLRIMDVVAASGSGFAFPSQTIYAGSDGGLDAARSRAAEAAVRRWREENRLWLPNLPSDEAAALRRTLDYPPVGSSQR
jgi:MscS family membrane protein